MARLLRIARHAHSLTALAPSSAVLLSPGSQVFLMLFIDSKQRSPCKVPELSETMPEDDKTALDGFSAVSESVRGATRNNREKIDCT